MPAKTILVTGANGLIGYDVVQRLVAEGRRVIAVDRTIADVAALTPHAFELEIGDLHRLHQIASQFEIDAILHCGGVSGPMLYADNPSLMFDINVGGTKDMVELARQITVKRGRCRFVFCSSLTIYGNEPRDDITEDFPALTWNCYASSKVAGEAIIDAYRVNHGVDAIILRLAGVYGPRRRTACILRQMVGDALAGRPTHLNFGKGFARQWVHVDDIVEGIVLALDVEAPQGRIFNISANENPLVDEAADIITELLPTARITLDPGPEEIDITLGRLSSEAARRELGYVPKVPLREGITRLVAAMRAEAAR